MKHKWKTVLKISVSLALLALLLKLAGPERVFNTIREGDAFLFFVGFLFILAGTFLAAYRWRKVMAALDFKGGFSFYLKSYFMGIFFNQLLPSSIGGDAYRVIDVSRMGYRKRDAFIGVMIDRGLGVLGIFLVNIIFNNLLPGLLPDAVYALLNFISAAGIAGFAGFVFLHKLNFLKRFKSASFFIRSSAALYKVLDTFRRFLTQICLTVGVHLLTFAGVYFIALGIGISLSVSAFMVIMPPVILLTLVPVSLAGWGVREGAMVGLLGLAGVPGDMAMSLSILYGFSYVIQGAVGLILRIKTKEDGKVAHES